ncbi:MAG: hypothetical protein E7645_09375 [Ruminococcaceae bacterium]|nr:hypothetical protein [Oscillospiraceae bacterium]
MPYKIHTAPKPRPSGGQIFFYIMSTFCLLLILRNSEAAIEYMGRGLTLCAHTVIPSLFPFMVISELLVQSGAGEALGRLLAKPMKFLFGLSGAGCSAVVLGSMCGFPVGASVAVSLLDKNVISKKECEHLLTFSNNPSSGFLITAVGVSLFGSRGLGLILYLVVLGSSFFIGFFLRFFMRNKEKPRGKEEHPHFPSGLHPGGITMFTNAVSHAAGGMMTVCAYVIFFSAMTGALTNLLQNIDGVSHTFYALLCGFFEISGGISAASALVGETAFKELPMILAACMAGWSGVSVHCQIMTLCGGRGLSFKPYIIAKALQGILCGGAMWIILSVADPSTLPPLSETVAHWIPTISRMGMITPWVTTLSHIGLVGGIWGLWHQSK